MHPYGQRTVRAWQCRFSKLGWTVRVGDGEPGSPSNISNLIDINDPDNFPRSFTEGTLGGRYGIQHTSDLVRFPLLLKYGGVYADVGMIQIGDLEAHVESHGGQSNSPYEVLTYNAGLLKTATSRTIPSLQMQTTLLFCALTSFCWRCGQKTGAKLVRTACMHTSVLLKELPLTPFHLSFAEDGKVYSAEDVTKMLADYIIQGQAIRMVMSTENPDGWNRPKYSAEHVFAIDYMIGSQLINEMTAWSSPRQFELMCLPLPKAGEAGSKDQKLAREIVEACLGKSFGPRARDNLNNEHGLVLYKVDTLINIDLL